MTEYIERSVSVNLLIFVENKYNRNRDHENISAETLYRDLCDAEIQIVKTPAAYVAPVVHGWWDDNGTGIIICSECGSGYNLIARHTHYCPNCGAKMDKEDNDG